MADDSAHDDRRPPFWRNSVIAVLLASLSLEGVAIDVFEQTREQTREHQEIQQVQQEERTLQNAELELDKHLAVVQALQTPEKHVLYSHLPGSVCVCIRGTLLEFQSRICERDPCDSDAIHACERENSGFRCRPLSQ